MVLSLSSKDCSQAQFVYHVSVSSLVPRPLLPEERSGTHCSHMHKIFHSIFYKKLCALNYLVHVDNDGQRVIPFVKAVGSQSIHIVKHVNVVKR